VRFDEACSGNVYIDASSDLERAQAVLWKNDLNGNRDGHEEKTIEDM
jgi:hypothetical protein